MGGLRVALIAAEAGLAERAASSLAGAGLSVVHRADSVDALLDGELDCDVIVVVADMGAIRTAQVVRAVRERAGGMRLVILRTTADGHAARRCLEAGADGLVDAEQLELALPAAVRAVAVGLVTVPQAIRRVLAPAALSHRERQVLALVVEGCTNAEIAQRLFLAESTVKSHLATAFTKLGVRSRRDATALILAGASGAVGVLAGDEGGETATRRFQPGAGAPPTD